MPHQIYAPTDEDIALLQRHFPYDGLEPDWDRVRVALISSGVSSQGIESMTVPEILAVVRSWEN